MPGAPRARSADRVARTDTGRDWRHRFGRTPWPAAAARS